MRRGPFGTGIFPWQGGGGQRRTWGTVHTGILCPFCREGELYVGYDEGQTRRGLDPYYIGCTNNPRQGAICSWMERTKQDGQPINREEAEAFKIYQRIPQTMMAMLRINVPEISPETVLEEYKPEGIQFMYGPPRG